MNRLFVVCLLIALHNEVEAGLSKCQKEAKPFNNTSNELSTGGVFRPMCKADGSYNNVQCHESINACWCVNPETGTQIIGTLRQIQHGIPQCGCGYTCTEEYMPVCGSDGVTYENDCYLENVICNSTNLKLAYGGKCEEKDTVNSSYTQWSEYGKCSKSCGGGLQFRTRQCTNQKDGSNCSNLPEEVESIDCNVKKCPVHGGYTQWSEYGKCTKTCGGGLQFRTRQCTNPIPKDGGMNCSTRGDKTETRDCNIKKCPVNGGYSQWSEYGKCTKSCGGGFRFRIRWCTNPSPKDGGDNCAKLGPTYESGTCNVEECPVNGGFTQWSNFSSCTQSCGGGMKFRMRSCTNPSPEAGGKDCSTLGNATQTVPCNNQNCTGIERDMVKDAARGAASKRFSTDAMMFALLGWLLCAIHRLI